MKSSSKRISKPKIKIKKIEIVGSDFTLQSDNSADSYLVAPCTNMWDLFLPKTVNKGKVNERTELKWDSFCTFEAAVNKIVYYRIRQNQLLFKGKGDEGLATFFDTFRQEKHKLVSLFDKTEEEWNALLVFDKGKKSYKAILE